MAFSFLSAPKSTTLKATSNQLIRKVINLTIFSLSEHVLSQLMKKLFRKTIELPLEIVELEEHNYHLMLKSRLSNGDEAWWIVDTGASKTVFDRNQGQYFSLVDNTSRQQYQSAGINEGMVETKVGNISKIQFGQIKIKNLKVALIDLKHVNEIYQRYHDKHVAGLLGSDVLANYGCQIDYLNKSITFQTKPML